MKISGLLKHWRFGGLLILLATIFSFINFQHTDIALLSPYQGDEFFFYTKLLTMYDGIRECDYIKFFSYGVYNYGTIFFALNLFLSLPFLFLKHYETVIFICRMSSAIFALIALTYTHRLIRLYCPRKTTWLITLLIVAMPGFWKNGTIHHPDWMMTCFLIMSFYYLAKAFFASSVYLKENPKLFWMGVVFFALAVSSKFQAILFLPLFFFLIAYREWAHLDFSHFKNTLIKGLKVFVAILLIFVLTNPYLLHPTGRYAFQKALNDNIKSNITNHGSIISVTLSDKVMRCIGEYYFPPILFIVILTLVIYTAIRFLRSNEDRVFISIALTTLTVLGYQFIAVNKLWQHYYLYLSIPLLICLIPFLRQLKPSSQTALLGICLIIQIGYFLPQYPHLVPPETTPHLQHHQAISTFLTENLSGKVLPKDYILISIGTGFDFHEVGLPHDHLTIIGGPLTEDLLTEKAFKEKWKKVTNSRVKAFHEKTFIILRKDDIFFNASELALVYDKVAYNRSLQIIKDLKNGSRGYALFKEDKNVYILKKTTAPIIL